MIKITQIWPLLDVKKKVVQKIIELFRYFFVKNEESKTQLFQV